MLSSVSASRTRAVITGDEGTVLTSDDGVLWTARSSGVTNWIYHTAYLNGQFVGVGEGGVVVTSSDGLAWTRRNSGTTKWLNTVGFHEGKYYAAGGQGTVLASSDAVSWTLLPPVTSQSLYGWASTEGQIAMCGTEGAILRARVIPWTSPVNLVSFTQQTNAHIFLFNGKLDQRFSVERSPDLRRWVDTLELEILDNTGASIFYDAIINGAQWFFRTRLLDP
jgi:hypothetical protein